MKALALNRNEQFIDELLCDYEEEIKKTGVEAIWRVGEILSEAKKKVIDRTRDKRAPGFLEWSFRKFNFQKSSVSRYIKAFKTKNENIKEIWGHTQKSVALALPINPPPPLPAGKYAVIYADPPWQYDFSLTDSRKIENQYPTMPVEEICALEIPAADDCVLFLWATNPKLPEALQVIHAWGFEYKTNMVWVKNKIGMGYYCRSQHELLLIAGKGKAPIPQPENRCSSVIEADRLEHSSKPIIVYELVEQMYPEHNKIELFARVKRDGWDSWGNEN